MKNSVLVLLFIMAFPIAALAQGASDPCRLNEAAVPKALTFGYSDVSAKDSAFEAVVLEWMKAGTTVTKSETGAVAAADIRRRADAELQHREMILKADLFLRQREIDIICGEVIKLRVAQAASNRLRAREVSSLRQATSQLQKTGALGAAEIRARYSRQTDTLAAESKDPQRAANRIAADIKAATALRDDLRAAVNAK